MDLDLTQYEPGARLPDETEKAFRAFSIYLDLGEERTRERVAEIMGHKSVRMTAHWSVQWRWGERVKLWTDAAQAVQADAFVDELEKLGRKHAQAASATLTAMLQPITDLQQRMKEAKERGEAVRFGSNVELMRLIIQIAPALKTVVEVERLAHGQHTDSTLVNVNGQSEEQQAQNDEVAKRILEDPETAKVATELLGRLTAPTG